MKEWNSSVCLEFKLEPKVVFLGGGQRTDLRSLGEDQQRQLLFELMKELITQQKGNHEKVTLKQFASFFSDINHEMTLKIRIKKLFDLNDRPFGNFKKLVLKNIQENS